MLLKFLFKVCLIFTVATVINNNVSATNCSHNVFYEHLLFYVVPKHYDILITPHNNTFNGTVIITIDINRISNVLNFHAHELKIYYDTISLSKGNYIMWRPQEHSYCNETQIVLLKFKELLTTGEYKLRMNFTGSLHGTGGFTTIDYITKEKQELKTYLTLFEPERARRAFPCWDVPWLQASFDIIVVHSAQQHVWSNMPHKETTIMAAGTQIINNIDDLTLVTTFNIDSMIPTHLLMIAIIDTAHISYTYKDYKSNGTYNVIHVWGRRNKLKELTIMQEFAQNITQFLTEQMEFSWRKSTINFLVLPKLPIEGMGSWELAVVREEDVICEEEHSLGFKIKAQRGIAREIVRQYLDTSISPNLWSDLWFHKGLTLYLSYYIIQQYYNWDPMSDFYVVQVQQPAMYNDIARNMIALDDESDPLFAPFSYNKASALIRMLQYVVKEAFQKAVITYINHYKNSRANLDAFWEILRRKVNESGNKINVNIKEMMDSWLRLRYYPTLLVERHRVTGVIHCQQIPTTLQNYTNENMWRIPLTYTTQSEQQFEQISPEFINTNIFHIHAVNSSDWVIFNIQQSGYYRVNYDENNWLKIAAYLNTRQYTTIHHLNRAQLIDDAYHFTMRGEMSYNIFFKLIQYLEQEVHFIPWHTMLNILHYMSPFFEFPESQDFKHHMLDIISNFLVILSNTKLPSDSEQIWAEMRVLILNWACKHGHYQCRKWAHHDLETHLEHKKQPPSTRWWRDWTYCSGMIIANKTTWDKAVNYFLYQGDMEMLKYLTCSEDVNINYKFLYSIVSDDHLTDGRNIWALLTVEERMKLFRIAVKKHVNHQTVRRTRCLELANTFPGRMNITELLGDIIMNTYTDCNLKKVWKYCVMGSVADELLPKMKRLIMWRKDELDRQRQMFARHFTPETIIIDEYCDMICEDCPIK